MGYNYGITLSVIVLALVGFEASPENRRRIKTIFWLFLGYQIVLLFGEVFVDFPVLQVNGWESYFSPIVPYLWRSILLFVTIVFFGAQPAIRQTLRKFYLGAFSFLLTLFLLDKAFGSLYLRSDGFGFTLASHQWFAHYWNPINSLGYRDKEHSSSEIAGKRLLLVVGDSFVAGHGIEHIEDRFSNILQTKLGKDWIVANVAKYGWDTPDEIRAIRGYPFKPRVIVLSYFLNDIGPACAEAGHVSPQFIDEPAWFLKSWVQGSYLVNFVYWKIYRIHNIGEISRKYWSYMDSCFEDSSSWRLHQQELVTLVQYTRQRDIRLAVVVFPSLNDIASTSPFAAKVANVFEQQHIPVLDLAPLLAGRTASELTVNSLDGHPSKALHREVAERLYRLLNEQKVLSALRENNGISL